jgi:hypothetical protein
MRNQIKRKLLGELYGGDHYARCPRSREPREPRLLFPE